MKCTNRRLYLIVDNGVERQVENISIQVIELEIFGTVDVSMCHATLKYRHAC